MARELLRGGTYAMTRTSPRSPGLSWHGCGGTAFQSHRKVVTGGCARCSADWRLRYLMPAPADIVDTATSRVGRGAKQETRVIVLDGTGGRIQHRTFRRTRPREPTRNLWLFPSSSL